MNAVVEEMDEVINQILSPILARTNKGRLAFFCPGCKTHHYLRVRTSANEKPSWVWNGNVNLPTFLPSYHEKTGHHVKGQPQPPNCEECFEAKLDKVPSACSVCHSVITNGVISFLSDCTHEYAGQEIKIPPLPKVA